MQEETEKITCPVSSSQVVAACGSFGEEFFEAGRHGLSLKQLKFVTADYSPVNLSLCAHQHGFFHLYVYSIFVDCCAVTHSHFLLRW